MARGAIAYKGQLYLGGSKVEANPTGSATGGNLSKLGVDDTVYAIPQVNNGTLTIQKNGTNVATFSANQSENVTANIDVSEDIAGTKTVSGNPITLTDAAPINAESLVVELEPNQDLHGQSAPYVGGVGKNKLPMTVAGLKSINSSTGTWSGNVYTREGCTFEVLTDSDNNVVGIKVNAPSSHNTATFSFGDFTRISGTTYILNGCPANGTTASYKLRWNDVGYDYGNGITTDGTAGTGTVAIDIMSNTAVTNLIFYPMIRLSTETDPTFAPYSNICPITGYTEVNVDDVGKNLFDKSNVQNGALDSSGNVYLSPSDTRRVSDYIEIEPNTVYYLSNAIDLANGRTGFWYDENKTAISQITFPSTVQKSGAITSPNNAKYAIICVPSATLDTAQLEKGSTATAYEPYQSRTASVTFGQTVYGGSVDVTNGGTDDDTKVTVLDGTVAPTNSFVRDNTVCGCVLIADQKKYSITHQTKVMCDSMPVFPPDYVYENDVFGVCENISSASNGILVSVYKDMLTSYDITGLQAWLVANNLQVAYERETNVDIATPPTELKLLQGTNNITTNGTTITLGYQPDNVIGDAVRASEEYTDRRMDALGDLAYINEDGDNSTKFLRGDGTWQNTPAGVTTLADLTDTNVSSPSNGQVLKYNGSKWVNAAESGGGATTLSGLTDTSISSPASNQVLEYDGTSGFWANYDKDIISYKYTSKSGKTLTFNVPVSVYNTQKILKFCAVWVAGNVATEYIIGLDRGDAYINKIGGSDCAISASYSSLTYTLTITLPSAATTDNFVYSLVMLNGAEKTW